MDNLHAPWRIEYILAPKDPSPEGQSIFTQIGQSNEDEKNYVIAREKSCYAVLNTYPYNCGHVMVIPYRQIADLPELTEPEMLELMLLTRRVQQAIRKTMNPTGFNIGLNLGKVAGAGIVEHLHFHIVPRWDGDTNFMAVIGNTGVLPEALTEVAAKLRRAMQDSAA